MKLQRLHILLGILLFCVCLLPFREQIRNALRRSWGSKHHYTVSERVLQYGPGVRSRLSPYFAETGITYPPKRIVVAVFKQEKRLDVWVGNSDGTLRLLKSYPVLGASGQLGPKLAEGDHQVPEGLYRIESLNPNSAFHLSLRLNYPNAFDQAKAKLDGRTDLGSDIMIHGGSASVGCIALGDLAAEELFILAAETELPNILVILSPVDFRVQDVPPGLYSTKSWTAELYRSIREELSNLRP